MCSASSIQLTSRGPEHDKVVPVSDLTSDVAEGLATHVPAGPEEATLEQCKIVLHAYMKRIRDIGEDDVDSASAILEVFEQVFPGADIEVAV